MVYGVFLAKCGRRRDIKARFPRLCRSSSLVTAEHATVAEAVPPGVQGCRALWARWSEAHLREAGVLGRAGRVSACSARDGRAACGQLVRRPAAITVGAPPIRPVTSRTSQCGGRQRARPAGLAGAAARHSGGVTRGRRERAPPWAAARGSGGGARGRAAVPAARAQLVRPRAQRRGARGTSRRPAPCRSAAEPSGSVRGSPRAAGAPLAALRRKSRPRWLGCGPSSGRGTAGQRSLPLGSGDTVPAAGARHEPSVAGAEHSVRAAERSG